jgi:hypothetical protein
MTTTADHSAPPSPRSKPADIGGEETSTSLEDPDENSITPVTPNQPRRVSSTIAKERSRNLAWSGSTAIPPNKLPHKHRNHHHDGHRPLSPNKIKQIKKKLFRPSKFEDGDEDPDWWFASTAIPLLAATIAPLANVLSIAALVTYWRMDLDDGNGGLLPPLQGVTIKDPRW